jgi:hypothetical protein
MIVLGRFLKCLALNQWLMPQLDDLCIRTMAYETICPQEHKLRTPLKERARGKLAIFCRLDRLAGRPVGSTATEVVCTRKKLAPGP